MYINTRNKKGLLYDVNVEIEADIEVIYFAALWRLKETEVEIEVKVEVEIEVEKSGNNNKRSHSKMVYSKQYKET